VVRWLSAALALSLSGCGLVSPRAIIVPLGEPVMLLEEIQINSKVLVAQDGGQWVEAEVDYLPAGWACLAPEPGDFDE
tara:strand:- start:34 stop:267 length:234 start_codon:yes stop_codon:yes gene_type:complete